MKKLLKILLSIILCVGVLTTTVQIEKNVEDEFLVNVKSTSLTYNSLTESEKETVSQQLKRDTIPGKGECG